MVLSELNLRRMLSRNGWFTHGTNGVYDKLLEKNSDYLEKVMTESQLSFIVYGMSLIIWACSDDVEIGSIYHEILNTKSVADSITEVQPV